eukprot:m.20482 g.20482  ORF g.20482 m.20482 type:complete len:69 (-) comp8896_c0_seq1:2845-3051(-)
MYVCNMLRFMQKEEDRKDGGDEGLHLKVSASSFLSCYFEISSFSWNSFASRDSQIRSWALPKYDRSRS